MGLTKERVLQPNLILCCICFRNQIELACEVLKTFLSALDPAVILSHYGVAVVRALKHPNVEVKQLVLKEV